jgi:hypothetical protein
VCTAKRLSGGGWACAAVDRILGRLWLAAACGRAPPISRFAAPESGTTRLAFEHGAHLCIAAPTPQVKRMVRITGADNILDTHADPVLAVAV